MRAIVVSPHPDDETLGAGGTILKLISQGEEIVWLNVTNMKPEYGYSIKKKKKRADQIEQVKKATGYSAFYDLGLQPAALDQYMKTDIISKMKDVFDEIRPELVFLPSPQDAHSDHRIVYECALACTKAFRAPYVRKILCMDIISETNFSVEPFNANCYINISQFIEKKLNIMAHYQSEFLEPPFPRSKEACLHRQDTRDPPVTVSMRNRFKSLRKSSHDKKKYRRK